MGHTAGTEVAGPATSDGLDFQQLTTFLRLLTSSGDFGSLAHRLGTLHVDYPEAARRLNIPEKWLRERILSLPHRKMGKFVRFTDEDLEAISELYAVRPNNSERISAQVAPLTPSRRSRSRSRV